MKGKIFNAQEVQAIIAGNKTMFREVIKPQPPLGCHYTINGNQSHALCFADCSTPRDERDYSKEPLVCVPPKPTNIDHRLECPYKVGEEIFVKESFNIFASQVSYKQGLVGAERYFWKPAQQMKQEHSRLTLEITDIKVERLQDISEEDAINEGVNKLFTEEEMKHVLKVHQIEKNDTYKNYLWHGHIGRTITKKQSDEWEYQCSAYEKAKDSFFSLWNATHKKPEEKFEANPFVWVVDFKINNLGGL